MVAAVNRPSTSEKTFEITIALGQLIVEVEIKMTGANYEIEKFSGNYNFTLWHRRMKDLLIQQKVHKVLSGKTTTPKTMKETQWEEMDEVAVGVI